MRQILLQCCVFQFRREKKQKADDLIGGRYGFSYNDFISFGKEKLPPDIFRETMLRVERLPLDAEAIVAGFVDADALLCSIAADGKVSVKDNFVAIGEGAYLATSVLLHREHDHRSSLLRTLYAVYEAKKYAERVPSVGKPTSMGIMSPRGRLEMVDGELWRWLGEKYREFGPKPIPDDLTFDGEIWPKCLGEKQLS